MRYYINFDKTINQLVPYYLGGRKLILYLQALMKPLRYINDTFVEYAKETKIEATMTSQIGKFEWYLNRKFGKYFANGGVIAITNAKSLGVPIWRESANIGEEGNNIIAYLQEGDSVQSNPWVLYHSNEHTESNSASFIVTTPAINTNIIQEEEYIRMLKNTIDKYRIANKTYIIQKK